MALRPSALYQALSRDLQWQVPSFKDGSAPDATVTEFAAYQLAKNIFKKLIDVSSDDADKRALDDFLSSNTRCEGWSLTLENSGDELLVGLFENEVYELFDPLSLSLSSYGHVFQHGRFGPGASALARGNDFYTKVGDSVLSCTSKGLFDIYCHYSERNRVWRYAEETRSDAHDHYCIVQGNRLAFVPKNEDTSRCICIEPSLNMFFQLGLGKLIEQRVDRFFGIRLDRQPDKNRELARKGSIDGSFGTIDLKSASDSISLNLVRRFFPRSLTAMLERFRSRFCELPNGEQVELKLLSSMGNGFTFPLQTAIFACVVSAVYKSLNIPLERPRGNSLGNFGVFGDDIIVVARAYNRVCRLLNILGFRVNAEKSFNEGSFRESCGSDWYSGRNVRSVYIKSLRTIQDRVVVINLLNRWSAQSGIYLPTTVQLLRKTVPFTTVPLYENDDAGLKVPLSLAQGTTWNRDLHSVSYTKWESVPVVLRVGDGVIKSPKGSRKRSFNYYALLLSLLHGSLRSGSITIRHGGSRYRKRRLATSSWNSLGIGYGNVLDRWRLENAIRLNFTLAVPRD